MTVVAVEAVAESEDDAPEDVETEVPDEAEVAAILIARSISALRKAGN